MSFHVLKRILDGLLEYSFNNEPASDHHLSRFGMYASLQGKLSSYANSEAVAVSISGSQNLLPLLGLKAKEVIDARYPKYDILNLDIPSNSVDIVVSDQVLEHLNGSPYQAFDETLRVLKPGGVFCHTTCFLMPIHKDPSDLWRYTPQALEHLANHSGAEVIEAAGWGNKEAWFLMHMGYWKTKVPAAKNNPIHRMATGNDPNYPIMVWCLGRKP